MSGVSLKDIDSFELYVFNPSDSSFDIQIELVADAGSGSRSIVVEGAHICREAVLGSNTVITGSTHIIDVTGPDPVTYKGYVPPRSVVVPGSYRKRFPAGEYSVTCALIIGQRKESTDKKTSLNNALRDFGVSV